MRNIVLRNADRRNFLKVLGAGVSLSFGASAAAPNRPANDNSTDPSPTPNGGRLPLPRHEFFTTLRATKVLGAKLGPSQLAGINGILDAFAELGDGNPKTLAYALATAALETGRRMSPVREGFAKSDDQARRILKHQRYAHSAGKYGHAYYGRGQIQLTWEKNYQASSHDAGVDLVANPDLMLNPKISARILILGLIDGRWNGSNPPHRGKGIGHYLPRGAKDDVKNARRTVNRLDKWKRVASFYRVFLAVILQASSV